MNENKILIYYKILSVLYALKYYDSLKSQVAKEPFLIEDS